ncbi:MAG: efflux RND transporter periplasmic adaptor subunit [bacterium]
MKITTKPFILALLVGVGAISISSCGKSNGAETAKTAEVFTVKVAHVEDAAMTSTFKANGSLEGIREATLTSETQGRILGIEANNGSRVGQGQAIVTVDNELKAIALKQAEAQRLTAEASLEKAKIDLTRIKDMQSSGAVTKSQMELAELQVKSAEAMLKAAESGESLAKRQLSDATVKAPFSGVVAMRYVNLGELLSNGTRVAMIIDDSKMKLKIGISELDVPLVKVGDKVKVTVDALGGKEFVGTITTISSKADMARSFTVEVEIPNSDKGLKSGMFARAEIDREASRTVPCVPRSAIINNGMRQQVFSIDDKNIAHLKGVKLGTQTNEKAEIVEGIALGETVVTFGQPQLKDGAKVLIQN